jgi:superfamily I DNA/RNA helicase
LRPIAQTLRRLVGLPENFSIYDVEDSQACLKQAVKKANVELTHIRYPRWHSKSAISKIDW